MSDTTAPPGYEFICVAIDPEEIHQGHELSPNGGQ